VNSLVRNNVILQYKLFRTSFTTSSILIIAIENDASKCVETFCYTISTFRTIILLTCLHDQNKSAFCGGPAFIQPINAV